MNNEQIDKTDYYRLPCGKFLEDYIAEMQLDFATGSALKYRFRAGKKDGETKAKDTLKSMHYCTFLAARRRCDVAEVVREILALYNGAMVWGMEVAK